MDRPRTVGGVWTDDETGVLVDMMLGIRDAGERWQENIDMVAYMIELSLPDLVAAHVEG
ncbi:CDK5 regulatory subunit-associated protein 3 [Corchorus olitorius]|uniref:CDK5 regulatory subunit-associated protein 3 n=1 Tax=Corchorus olitorius TaxID=93759 RepID=A0A1R3JP36_9ROSI|nr:CDK5 regulatory subunit-associated protein 3 [Corchorus olitorius]